MVSEPTNPIFPTEGTSGETHFPLASTISLTLHQHLPNSNTHPATQDGQPSLGAAQYDQLNGKPFMIFWAASLFVKKPTFVKTIMAVFSHFDVFSSVGGIHQDASALGKPIWYGFGSLFQRSYGDKCNFKFKNHGTVQLLYALLQHYFGKVWHGGTLSSSDRVFFFNC